MIKLHLFTGFENKSLKITPDMELGHLYDDQNDRAALILAAGEIGLAAGYIQVGNLIHFDLWNQPLARAKQLYRIVTDEELAEDMKRLNLR